MFGKALILFEKTYTEENTAKNGVSVTVKSDCLWLLYRALGSLQKDEEKKLPQLSIFCVLCFKIISLKSS